LSNTYSGSGQRICRCIPAPSAPRIIASVSVGFGHTGGRPAGWFGVGEDHRDEFGELASQFEVRMGRVRPPASDSPGVDEHPSFLIRAWEIGAIIARHHSAGNECPISRRRAQPQLSKPLVLKTSARPTCRRAGDGGPRGLLAGAGWSGRKTVNQVAPPGCRETPPHWRTPIRLQERPAQARGALDFFNAAFIFHPFYGDGAVMNSGQALYPLLDSRVDIKVRQRPCGPDAEIMIARRGPAGENYFAESFPIPGCAAPDGAAGGLISLRPLGPQRFSHSSVPRVADVRARGTFARTNISMFSV